MYIQTNLHLETQTGLQPRAFAVTDLDAAGRFWDPLMAFLGWTRVDDGIGAVVYEGGNSAIMFTSGDAWEQGMNDTHRVSPFAHLAFDVTARDELTALGRSLEERAGAEVHGPRLVCEGGRWLWALEFQDPNGLEIEVRCPRQ